MAWNGRLSRVHDLPRPGMPVGVPIDPHRPPPVKPRRPEPLDDVPGLSRARLPANYQAARETITECSRIDECKAWSDKAAALASYARQARDSTLRVMAERIHARAIRR